MDQVNKKILIVEDDEDFLSILKMKFESEGFSVVSAENGEAGVVAAENEKPDLIFSDVLMPQMDGVAMVGKIREANKDVPIIFLTNIKEADYIDKIKKIGEFDYLIKSALGIGEIVDKAKNKLGLR